MSGNLVLGVTVGEHTVGIWLHEETVLVFGVDGGSGPVVDDTVPCSYALEGQTVVAGLLPDGATKAIAIDDGGVEFEGVVRVGLYVIEAGEAGRWHHLVRFEDDDGALVALPLPDGPRAAVTDAPEPCPLCAAVAWVRIVEEVFCGTCGLYVGDASLSDDDEDDEEEALEDSDDFDAEAVWAAIPYPIYAGGEMTGGGFSSVGGGIPGTVEVQTGALHVATGVQGARDPRQQLAEAVQDFDGQWQRSSAGQTVHWFTADQARHRFASTGRIEERELVIDGRPEPFAFIAAGDAWAATREHRELFVTVWARGIDPSGVRLAPLES